MEKGCGAAGATDRVACPWIPFRFVAFPVHSAGKLHTRPGRMEGMHVKDLMSTPVVTVDGERRLDEVADLMLANGIDSVLVVDPRGRAQGILTARDFTAREPSNPFQKHRAPRLFGQDVREHGLDHLYAQARVLRAARLMRDIPAAVVEEATVEQVVDLMNRHDVLHVPVLRKGRPVGMVSRHDLLRLAAKPTKGNPRPAARTTREQATRRRALPAP